MSNPKNVCTYVIYTMCRFGWTRRCMPAKTWVTIARIGSMDLVGCTVATKSNLINYLWKVDNLLLSKAVKTTGPNVSIQRPL